MKKVKFNLHPLIEMKNQKIDYRNLNRMLIDNYGQLTAAGKCFGINTVNYRFEEQDEQQKYKLTTELFFDDLKINDFRVIFGESGLFLKYNEALDFQSIIYVVNLLEVFTNVVKLYLYMPIGRAYYSDGITYLRNDANLWSAKRAKVKYELFDDESEAEE